MEPTETQELTEALESVSRMNQTAVERMTALGFEHQGALCDLLPLSGLTRADYDLFMSHLTALLLASAQQQDYVMVVKCMNEAVLFGANITTLALTRPSGEEMARVN